MNIVHYQILLIFMLAVAKRSIAFRLNSRFGFLKPTTSVRHVAKKSIDIKENDWENASKGMTLVIVESPAKARTIQKFVDSESFIIDFSAGHIRDLTTKGYPSPEFESKIVCEGTSLTTASLGIDVYNNFKPLYVDSVDKGELIKRLKHLAKSATRILFATDEDREGEAISWHLLEVLNPKVPYKRAVFHEITKEAILKSFDNPRDIDMDLVHSQEARRIIDRLSGFTVSPLLWRYIAPGLSAGRVQSCGLHCITERERSRWTFVPSNYCSLSALFEPLPKSKYSRRNDTLLARLYSVNNQKVATEKDFDSGTGELKVLEKVKSNPSVGSDKAGKFIVLNETITHDLMNWLSSSAQGKVTLSITETNTRLLSRKAPVPYITSTLQQDGSRQLGFSPSQTMAVAQKLYEKGHITYMRTDSPTLSSTALAASQKMVSTLFSAEYLAGGAEDASTGKNDAKSAEAGVVVKGTAAPKNAQEAHEAIRPAEHNGQFKMPSDMLGLSTEEFKVYKLILKRTLASVMKPSQATTNTYTITATNVDANANSTTTITSATDTSVLSEENSSRGNESGFQNVVFRSSDTQVTFPGFLAVNELFSPAAGSKSQKVSASLLPTGLTLRLSSRTDFAAAEEDSAGSETAAAVDGSESSPGDVPSSSSSSSAAAASATTDGADPLDTFPGLKTSKHSTRPPQRFNEASFIQELENLGVGRPSTYSSILKTLQDRGYIVVDKQSLIPTIQGMVVSQFLEKHFPQFVDPDFTAAMERSLDMIARGEEDRGEVLHKFYLQDNGKVSDPAGTSAINGLLPMVEAKLRDGNVGSDSRKLEISYLKDLGVFQSYFSNIVFEENMPSANSSAASGSSSDGAAEMLPRGRKWTLPERLTADLRGLTRENIQQLMLNEQPKGGQDLGSVLVGSRFLPMYFKSSKYGRFIQVGSCKKDIAFYSVLKDVDGEMTRDDALMYIGMPKVLGRHPTMPKDVLIEVKYGDLVVGVEGYSLRVLVPRESFVHINDITLESILPLLPSASQLHASTIALGQYNGLDVTISNGKFGPHIRCGSLFVATKGVDVSAITLESAIKMIEARLASPTNSAWGKTQKVLQLMQIKPASSSKKNAGDSVVKSNMKPSRAVKVVKSTGKSSSRSSENAGDSVAKSNMKPSRAVKVVKSTGKSDVSDVKVAPTKTVLKRVAKVKKSDTK